MVEASTEMRLYEVFKTETPSGKTLFSANATELGLARMGARIANDGASDSSSELGRKIAFRLACGAQVIDPIRPGICWSAHCLGDNFKYCSSLLFPTEMQMARFMETRR